MNSRSTEPEAGERRERWMREALREAERGRQEGEVPVGAVAVLGEHRVAAAHNRTLQWNDPTAHAEILLIRESARRLGNYRLAGLEIYVTLEPCAMCAGALVWARVQSLFFGASDEKAGAVHSRVSLLNRGLFNHTIEVTGGVLAVPCAEILQDFFRERR